MAGNTTFPTMIKWDNLCESNDYSDSWYSLKVQHFNKYLMSTYHVKLLDDTILSIKAIAMI